MRPIQTDTGQAIDRRTAMKSRTGIVILSPSTWTFSACLLAVFRTCSTEEIKKHTGGDVLLQCHSPRGADINLVEWIKPDLVSEDYVFIFRDNRTYENYQHPSFHGRVELKDSQMKDGDASVILNNVTVKDNGTYECYVGKKGKTPQLISRVQLQVKDSGGGAGHTEDGGDTGGGDKDGGDKDGDKDGEKILDDYGIGVGVLALTAGVGFVLLTKLRGLTDLILYQPPAGEAGVVERV